MRRAKTWQAVAPQLAKQEQQQHQQGGFGSFTLGRKRESGDDGSSDAAKQLASSSASSSSALRPLQQWMSQGGLDGLPILHAEHPGSNSLVAANKQADLFMLTVDESGQYQLKFCNLRPPRRPAAEALCRIALTPHNIPASANMHTLSFNAQGDRLLLLGSNYLGVVVLPERHPHFDTLQPTEGEEIFSMPLMECGAHLHISPNQIVQAAWHPLSPAHIVTLVAGEQGYNPRISLYNTEDSFSVEIPEQDFECDPYRWGDEEGSEVRAAGRVPIVVTFIR